MVDRGGLRSSTLLCRAAGLHYLYEEADEEAISDRQQVILQE